MAYWIQNFHTLTTYRSLGSADSWIKDILYNMEEAGAEEESTICVKWFLEFRKTRWFILRDSTYFEFRVSFAFQVTLQLFGSTTNPYRDTVTISCGSLSSSFILVSLRNAIQLPLGWPPKFGLWLVALFTSVSPFPHPSLSYFVFYPISYFTPFPLPLLILPSLFYLHNFT